MAETTLSKRTRFLHWSVGLIFIGLICVGVYMKETKSYHLYDWHKSIGTLLFVLIMIRVVWRVKQGWPTQASGMPNWQRVLSRSVHWVLITCTVLMPVSGLLGTHFGGRDIAVFGLFFTRENLVDDKVVPRNEGLGDFMFSVHEYVAWAIVIALALHILGAIKHHFIDKDNTLRRMINGTEL